MELEVVKDAVRTLEAQGIPLADITSVMVREVTGFGSYTTITEHLRTIRGEAPAGHEVIEDGSSESNETAFAVLTDDTPVDIVQEAAAALQRAQQRLHEEETRIPELQAQVRELRQQVLDVTT
jgi:uncharacterized protein involved in exopolysaccharide biosynthesis